MGSANQSHAEDPVNVLAEVTTLLETHRVWDRIPATIS
jgi:hypothetical protein